MPPVLVLLCFVFVRFCVSEELSIPATEDGFVRGVEEPLEKSFFLRGSQEGNGRPVDPTDIVHVGVIFQTHFDAGFQIAGSNSQTLPVVSEYINVYLQDAIDTAEEVRRQGDSQSFRWTVQPWILDLAFNCPSDLPGMTCPSEELLTNVTKAVKRRDIQWHRGPMNMQGEIADASLYASGLDVAATLANRFGVEVPAVVSQRDVPGITRSVIRTSVAKGVKGMSFGINDGTTNQGVPNMFVWKDTAAQSQHGDTKLSSPELLVAYHQGGYPDEAGTTPVSPGGLASKHCHLLPSPSLHALCFAFRMDNGPPPNVTEVRDYYNVLKSEFPNAVIEATSYDEFFQHMETVKNQLPIVTAELGDTWINGVGSDPLKHALFRLVSRERRGFLLEYCGDLADLGVQACLSSLTNEGDRRLVQEVVGMDRFLLKVAEHTDGVADANDDTNWSNEAFRRARDNGNFVTAEASWQEQRNFVWWSVRSLSTDHPLRKRAQDAMHEYMAATTSPPNLEGLSKLELDKAAMPPGSTRVRCGHNLNVTLDSDGSMISLVTSHAGIVQEWASKDNPLGQLVYNSHNYVIGNQVNMSSANPEEKVFRPTLTSLHHSTTGSCRMVMLLSFDGEAVTKYGSPPKIWIDLSQTTHEQLTNSTHLSVHISWDMKKPTRLPESIFVNFFPRQVRDRHWWMDKMGERVSPTDIVKNGATQHLVQDGFGYTSPNGNTPTSGNGQSGLVVETIDSGLINPIVSPTGHLSGMGLYLETNLWKCNYPFYYPWSQSDGGQEGLLVRFTLKLT